MIEMKTVDELKTEEKTKMNEKNTRMLMVIAFLAGLCVALGAALAFGGDGAQGRPYVANEWDETMPVATYVELFGENEIAKQMAPRTLTTVDGANIDQLYWCYFEIGEYGTPVVQRLIDSGAGEPVIWAGNGSVPALRDLNEIDLTGKQVHLFVNGRVVFVGVACPMNMTAYAGGH